MERRTSPESKDRNYADYVDAVQREGYLKGKRAGERRGAAGKRLDKDTVDPARKPTPEPDPAR